MATSRLRSGYHGTADGTVSNPKAPWLVIPLLLSVATKRNNSAYGTDTRPLRDLHKRPDLVVPQ